MARVAKEELSDIWNSLQYGRISVSDTKRLFEHIDALESEFKLERAAAQGEIIQAADVKLRQMCIGGLVRGSLRDVLNALISSDAGSALDKLLAEARLEEAEEWNTEREDWHGWAAKRIAALRAASGKVK